MCVCVYYTKHLRNTMKFGTVKPHEIKIKHYSINVDAVEKKMRMKKKKERENNNNV